MLDITVLGAGAGGGFPQWNCASQACQRARHHDPKAAMRTQASLAISADKKNYYIVNASPDLRQQINQTPALHPNPHKGKRNSPIKGVILTNSEVDAIMGLLNLRERQKFSIYGTPQILDHMDKNPIFAALDPHYATRRKITLGQSYPLIPSNLILHPFGVPGKCPLYAEHGVDPAKLLNNGENIGLRFSDGHHRLIVITNCGAMTPSLLAKLDGADILFFDGTLYHNNEMIKAGLSHKTGKRMGHISIADPNGTFDIFNKSTIKRKIFIHINNSNPILLEDSPQYQKARQMGWEIPRDGMHITL